MNDLNARKKEFYRAYDDAALRILLDRYADREGEALRLELRALPPEENAAPAGEEEAVMRILSRCAGKKRAALRCSAALRPHRRDPSAHPHLPRYGGIYARL